MFGSVGRHILVGLQRWRRESAIAELRRLDDRMLNDIGICRNDIPRVVDGLFARPSKVATSAIQLLRGFEKNLLNYGKPRE